MNVPKSAPVGCFVSHQACESMTTKHVALDSTPWVKMFEGSTLLRQRDLERVREAVDGQQAHSTWPTPGDIPTHPQRVASIEAEAKDAWGLIRDSRCLPSCVAL